MQGRIEETTYGHGEEKASRARVPAPWEASGDATVAATPAPVPILSGVRPPRPSEVAAVRAAGRQEARLLSMGSIRRLGFALPLPPSWFSLKACFLQLEKVGSAN